jgi:hypothetical protein
MKTEKEYDGWAVEVKYRDGYTWLALGTVADTRERSIEKWLGGQNKRNWTRLRKKGKLRCVKVKVQKVET